MKTKEVNTLDGVPLWLLARPEHSEDILCADHPFLLINKYQDDGCSQSAPTPHGIAEIFFSTKVIQDFCKPNTMAIALKKSHRNMSNVVTIGRSKDADVIITRKEVSKKHCGLYFWNDAWYIVDMNSSNGTKLNSENLVSMKRTELESQSIIVLGGVVEMTFISPMELGMLIAEFGVFDN